MSETMQGLARLERALRNRMTARLRAIGLEPGQPWVLEALAERGEATQSELAQALGVSQPTASRVLARMERSGWIVRRPHPHDQRATLHVLTARGRGVLPEVERCWAGLDAEVLGPISGGERAQLEGWVERLLKNLG